MIFPIGYLDMLMFGDLCKTSPFARLLRQAQISILEIFNIFLRLKFSPSLYSNKIEHFSKVSFEQNANGILTDSDGMQKEAYFFGVPCVTMRTEIEWMETVEAGWNMVVGADRAKIVEAIRSFKMDNPHSELYGDGRAAEKII